MKLAILGSTGPSGLQLVILALKEGHEVVAIARSPEKFSEDTRTHPNFTTVKVDILSSEELAGAFDGCSAVLSCLGVPGMKFAFQTVTLYSESAKAIVQAMEMKGIRRLVVMSSWCTVYQADSPKAIEWLFKPLCIRPQLVNMSHMEQFLAKNSDKVDFTCVRPPGLANQPATPNDIKSVPDAQWVKECTTYSIPRADVARFMMQCVEQQLYFGKCVAISL